MKIQPVSYKTRSEIVAGRLAALLLDGSLKSGDQLPPERELINRLGVSRPTLREALKALAENNLIEARPGVGWFIRSVDAAHFAQVREMANNH
ncbi:MAG TPA: winged helix-turn-helix domain-containing protein, partial [Anaerolineales bacterium]|nr:winged helix-turn-helix domain-containing protein [Anaerolineales bacterium]